jgi:NadR type nicotinamide-nucleotide adenylyltransferase
VTGHAAPFRVVLIGPESTGKTWLAERLAATIGAPWSGEYAREFVEANPRPVVFEDVDAIGRGQVMNEDAAIAKALAAGSPLVIHDTDLVSTEVYSRHYYGDCPPWIPPAAAARLADLYLLHDVDVPWMEDGHMRAEPERRHELFELFRSTLTRLDASVVILQGSWDERFERALAAMPGSPRP